MANIVRDSQLEKIGIEYVKLFLEAVHRCKVSVNVNKYNLSIIEVWNPKGYEKNCVQIHTEPENSPTIGVLIAHLIQGRPVPILGIDYFLIKVTGVEGLYSLAEEKLQQLLLDKRQYEVVSCEDGRSVYARFERNLLLDHCQFYKA